MLVILLTFASAADAFGPLRCKGKIVDIGDQAEEVLALCGKPAKRITRKTPVRAGVKGGFTRFAGYSLAEQWIYDRGWGKFPAVLHFDNGIIKKIEHLPYRSTAE